MRSPLQVVQAQRLQALGVRPGVEDEPPPVGREAGVPLADQHALPQGAPGLPPLPGEVANEDVLALAPGARGAPGRGSGVVDGHHRRLRIEPVEVGDALPPGDDAAQAGAVLAGGVDGGVQGPALVEVAQEAEEAGPVRAVEGVVEEEGLLPPQGRGRGAGHGPGVGEDEGRLAGLEVDPPHAVVVRGQDARRCGRAPRRTPPRGAGCAGGRSPAPGRGPRRGARRRSREGRARCAAPRWRRPGSRGGSRRRARPGR